MVYRAITSIVWDSKTWNDDLGTTNYLNQFASLPSSRLTIPDNPSSTLLTTTPGTWALAPRGDRDAPPVNTGWYAVPATTGCNVDLQMPSGTEDAYHGWYDTAATTACDNDMAVKHKMALIEALAKDIQLWSGKDHDFWGVPRSAVSKNEPKVWLSRTTASLDDHDHPSTRPTSNLWSFVLLTPSDTQDTSVLLSSQEGTSLQQDKGNDYPRTEKKLLTTDLASVIWPLWDSDKLPRTRHLNITVSKANQKTCLQCRALSGP
jgi:hypothetical protein